MENPPGDYLHYVLIWVQISNIPVNCYTTEALTALGDLVGKTVVVAYDPSKPITQDFIRVQVKFNVANPLRRSKTITIKGKPTDIFFHYERVQKRCFHCQRLNHEKDYCPLVIKQRQEDSRLRREKMTESLKKKQTTIPEEDILFGIIDESLMGTDPVTGRSKIANDVLEEMRKYLKADTGGSHATKVDRIQQSLREVSKNPMSQRSILRLEAPPVITTDLNMGKGLVFDYIDNSEGARALSTHITSGKLLADSSKAYSIASLRSAPVQRCLLEEKGSAESFNDRLSDFPTVFRAGSFAPCSSGIVKRRPVIRRRPPKAVREQRKREATRRDEGVEKGRREGKHIVGSKKRKCSDEKEEKSSTSTKAVCLKVVPKEGLPNVQ